MTMSVAPGVKLDPTVLASTVPLKRVGTEEVRVRCVGDRVP